MHIEAIYVINRMSIRLVNIPIPINEDIPELIHEFSPEENLLMLKIGSECLREGRNAVAGLTQKEIYKKIKDESREQVEKLEIDLIVHRELTKQMEHKMETMYKDQMDQIKIKNEKLEETVAMLKENLKNYEVENKSLVHYEIEKAREKYELILHEKDKQSQLSRESFDKLNDKIVSFTSMSSTYKGKHGEKKFNDIADTFRDFNGFKIQDKHTQGGEGDFHMSFDEFTILVDAKNYKGKVPVTQREKIKKDLMKNEHINFAWLISLNTTIDVFDRAPIMYEWISTSKCVCYINNLCSYDEPEKILRVAWFTCKELYRMIDDVNDDVTELVALKEKQFRTNDKIKNLRKSVRELTTQINTCKKSIEVIDDHLKDLLEAETNTITNFSLLDDWWNENILLTEGQETTTSTSIWYRFKQDKKEYLKEYDINIETFKKFFITKLNCDSYSKRNGSYDIKGIVWKDKKVNEKLEVEEIELQKKLGKKEKGIKVKTEPLQQFYFDEITDERILNLYNENQQDITEISLSEKIEVWHIISLLTKHKTIKKRDEARGYSQYKDSDEYKNKIKSKA